MEALALLRLDPDDPHPLPEQVRRTPRGKDAASIPLGVPFSTDPDELADRLLEVLGDDLLGHDDERGVLVFPSIAELQAVGYEAVVEAIGEGGVWIEFEEDDGGENAAGAHAAELFSQAAGLLGGLDPAAESQLQGVVDDAGGIEALAERAQAMLQGTPLEAMMKQMGASAASAGPPDLGRLMAQAQQLAASMDPETLSALGEQLLGAPAEEATAEEDRPDDGEE